MATRAIKIFSWVLVLLAGLAVIAAGGLLLLSGSHWAREHALALAQEELRSQGVELSVEQVQGDLLGGLEIQGLRLATDGRSFFSARLVLLRHNPIALLGGRLAITRLELQEPVLSLPLPFESQGDGPGLPLSLSLSISQIKVTGGAVEPAEALGPIRRLENISLGGSLTLDWLGLGIKARVASVRALGIGSLPLDLAGQARLMGDSLVLSDLLLTMGPNQVSGKAVLQLKDFSLRTSLKAVIAQVSALPVAWPLPGPPPGPLHLEAEALGRPGDMRLTLRLEAGGGKARFSGTCDLNARSLKGSLKFKALDPAALGLAAAQGRLSGKAELKLAAGPGPVSLDAQMELTPSSLLGVPVAALSAQGSYDVGTITLDTLDASAPWGKLQAKGRVLLPSSARALSIQGRANFQGLGIPRALSHHLPAELAAVSLNGQLSAQPQEGRTALSLDLKDSEFNRQIAVKSLTAQGAWQAAGPVLESLAATGTWGELKARGRADQSTAALDFELAVPALADLQPFWQLAGMPAPENLGGGLEAKGRLFGPWSRFGLEVSAQGKDITAGTALAENLTLELHAKALLPRPRGQAQVEINGLSLGDLSLQSAVVSARLGQSGGQARLRVQDPKITASVTLRASQPPGKITRAQISELQFQRPGKPLWTQEGVSQLLAAPGRVSLSELTMASGDQSWVLLGSWRPQRVQAELRLQGLNLGRWLPPELAIDPGRLFATARIDGSLKAPRLGLKGRVSGLKGPGLPPTEISFDGRYGGETLRLDGSSTTAGWPPMELKAQMKAQLSLHPPVFQPHPGGLKVSLHGSSLPLVLVETLTPAISQVQGSAELELNIEGSLDDPQARGRLAIKDGSLVITPTGQPVRDINLLLRLEGRRVHVDQASARSRGTLELSGWVDLPLDQRGQVDLHAQGEGLSVSLGGMGQAVADLELAFTGPWSGANLKGRITPTALRITPGLSPPAAMDEVVILEPGQKPPPMERSLQPDMVWRPGGVLGAASLDVRADLSGRLKVEVNEGFVDLTGQAAVKKQPGGALTYHGIIRLRRGLIIIASRAFKVMTGAIDFRDRDRPDPDVSARAELTQGRNHISVAVAGTALSPILNLSSEPPMSQADILSTIIFGQPAQALSGSQTQGLSAQALALLGMKGAREMENYLGPQLAPDVVTVYEDYGSDSTLEAGKYLSPDLYLHYRQDLGEEGGQTVGLEYRLNRYFSVDSQVGDNRNTGMDILFNHDFGSVPPLLGTREKAKTKEKKKD